MIKGLLRLQTEQLPGKLLRNLLHASGTNTGQVEGHLDTTQNVGSLCDTGNGPTVPLLDTITSFNNVDKNSIPVIGVKSHVQHLQPGPVRPFANVFAANHAITDRLDL